MNTPDTTSGITGTVLQPADGHRLLTFENPHLICRTCGAPVPAWHQSAKCRPGCDRGAFNQPCGHLGVINTCPTWRPRIGCTCEEQNSAHAVLAAMRAA
ncbi:hypothetical protein [Streptomyces synnematoformans]|uniref:Uncharacterized protein n=1 Tax=Streptomyces synnematoformans TaxID=415721 RepID=A0ABN2XAB3_9ACTN